MSFFSLWLLSANVIPIQSCVCVGVVCDCVCNHYTQVLDVRRGWKRMRVEKRLERIVLDDVQRLIRFRHEMDEGTNACRELRGLLLAVAEQVRKPILGGLRVVRVLLVVVGVEARHVFFF